MSANSRLTVVRLIPSMAAISALERCRLARSVQSSRSIDRRARGSTTVEFGSLEWVDFVEQSASAGTDRMIPPAEAEALYYSHRELVEETGTQKRVSMRLGRYAQMGARGIY